MKNEIVEKYQSGQSMDSIRKELGISIWKVHRTVKLAGVAARSLKHSLPDDEIIRFYEKGKTIQEISDILQISPATVYRRLLSRGTKMRKRVFALDETLFEEIDSEWKAYLLGLIYADGDVAKNYVVKLALHEKDQEILRKLNDWIFNGANPLRFIPAKAYQGNDGKIRNNAAKYFFTINSKKVCRDLEKLGCGQQKSLTVGLPSLDSNMMPHFLRGYFDGDGCVSGRTWSIVSSDLFCLQLYSYLEKLGLHPKLVKYNSVSRVQCFRKKEIAWLYNYLYKNATIYLDRKREKFTPFLA